MLKFNNGPSKTETGQTSYAICFLFLFLTGYSNLGSVKYRQFSYISLRFNHRVHFSKVSTWFDLRFGCHSLKLLFIYFSSSHNNATIKLPFSFNKEKSNIDLKILQTFFGQKPELIRQTGKCFKSNARRYIRGISLFSQPEQPCSPANCLFVSFCFHLVELFLRETSSMVCFCSLPFIVFVSRGKVTTFWPLSIITIQQAFFFPRSLNWHHLLNLTAIKTYIYSTSRASQFFSLNAPIPWSNDWAEPRGGCTPLFKDNYFVTWKRA